MQTKIFGALLSSVLAISLIGAATVSEAQKRRGQRAQPWQVCGDPTMRCPGAGETQPYDLSLRIPPNTVIFESEMFYAVILKSISAKNDCEAHISEAERLEAQALFPHNKVFADRCPEPGTLFYTGLNSDYRFMAVFAGRTRAEAQQTLARVRATGKYPTANLRRMRAAFNGT
jgi:hypothetical protein